jgi:Zn finger protein HypA/HybF (possibly regulating hydrogenase expression)
MHEFSLMADLQRKVESLAREHNASKILAVTVKLGALAHLSPEHFRGHFVQAARGTVAEGAELHVQVLTDPADPHAQEILLESVEMEE